MNLDVDRELTKVYIRASHIALLSTHCLVRFYHKENKKKITFLTGDGESPVDLCFLEGGDAASTVSLSDPAGVPCNKDDLALHTNKQLIPSRPFLFHRIGPVTGMQATNFHDQILSNFRAFHHPLNFVQNSLAAPTIPDFQ